MGRSAQVMGISTTGCLLVIGFPCNGLTFSTVGKHTLVVHPPAVNREDSLMVCGLTEQMPNPTSATDTVDPES